jgi:hypothetical protein
LTSTPSFGAGYRRRRRQVRKARVLPSGVSNCQDLWIKIF